MSVRTIARRVRPSVRLVVAVTLMAAGLVAGAGPAEAATTNWPQFMFNARHTGFNPQETVITSGTVNNLNLEYVANAGFEGDFAGVGRAPAVVDGVAYLGTSGGRLVALPATGCGAIDCFPLWTATLSNGAFTTPAVANGIVYISSAGSVENRIGRLSAFRAAGCGQPTCQPLWTAAVPNTESSPTVSGGVVYIVSGDGFLQAFAAGGCGARTCRPLWKGAIGTSANAAPAVSGGVVYATSDKRLWAFRASGCGARLCAPLWRSSEVQGIVQGSGPTVGTGLVYFATSEFGGGAGTIGRVYAFSAGCTDNCRPSFVARPLDGDGIGPNLAVARGIVYASAVGFLYAFSATGCGQPTCGFLWFGLLPGPIAGTGASPSVAADLAYYVQDNGQVGAFAAQGCGEQVCSPVWSTITQPFSALMQTPVVVNGRLYAAGPVVGGSPTIWVYRPAA